LQEKAVLSERQSCSHDQLPEIIKHILIYSSVAFNNLILTAVCGKGAFSLFYETCDIQRVPEPAGRTVLVRASAEAEEG